MPDTCPVCGYPPDSRGVRRCPECGRVVCRLCYYNDGHLQRAACAACRGWDLDEHRRTVARIRKIGEDKAAVNALPALLDELEELKRGGNER